MRPVTLRWTSVALACLAASCTGGETAQGQNAQDKEAPAPAAPSEPSPAAPFTAPWTCFRGDGLNNACRSGTVSEAPRLLWTFDAKDEILSTPAIVGGTVYIGTSSQGLLALALDPGEGVARGKELWRAPIEAKVEAAPTVHQGTVYVGDHSGVLHAVEARTGKIQWKFDTTTADSGGQEIAGGAVVVGDGLLFGAYDHNLYCIGLADGKLRWRLETQGPVHATPVVVDGKTFVAGCDEQLRAVEVKTGAELGVLELEGYSSGTPAVSGNLLVLGTSDSKVQGIDWKNLKIAWSYENPDRKFPYQSGPAIGRLASGAQVAVIGGRDKLVHAIHLSSGKSAWTFTTRAKVDSSPVIVGRRVIAAGYDGNLYLLDLETGKEVWKYSAGGAFAGSPAVGEGRLVIANDEGLVHCFDLRP